MNKEELIRKLKEIRPKDDDADCDWGVAHADAEELLLSYINDPEITELWEELSKEWWYA